MKTLFLEAQYSGEIKLNDQTLKFLEGTKSVVLFSSIQFIKRLETIISQLKILGVKVIITKAERTHVKGQILGCDAFNSSLNLPIKEDFDYFLYIGDGRFHPLALVLAQKDNNRKFKEIICDDPINKTTIIMKKREMKKVLMNYRVALGKFLSAKTVGVIITTKPGQQFMELGNKLKEKYSEKTFYSFVDDVISFDQLENFPFIDMWVNTACPRIGFDDQEKFYQGVINISDTMNAKEIFMKMKKN